MSRSTTPRKEAISTSTLPEQPGVLVAKRHHLLVRWSHWLNVPILLGLILSGISIYWSSPIYQHKPDPVTGNFDVAADIGIWICAHVPGPASLQQSTRLGLQPHEPRAGYVGRSSASPLAVRVRIHAEWCGVRRRVDRRRRMARITAPPDRSA